VAAEPASLAEPDEDEGLKPIPDRLMTELTAHRTLALRYALGEQADVAFLAALSASRSSIAMQSIPASNLI